MDEAYAYKARFNVYLVLLDNFSFEVLIRCENLSKYVYTPFGGNTLAKLHNFMQLGKQNAKKITKKVIFLHLSD